MSLRTVRLLLKNGASTDLLCDGHSPLSLAIISGNDMVCLLPHRCLTLTACSTFSIADKLRRNSNMLCA